MEVESGADAIRFNLSHSHKAALYAVARDSEVGVDLEFMRGTPQAEQIAERFFSSQEVLTLRSLPPALRRHAFFLCWSARKRTSRPKEEGFHLNLGLPGHAPAVAVEDKDRL